MSRKIFTFLCCEGVACTCPSHTSKARFLRCDLCTMYVKTHILPDCSTYSITYLTICKSSWISWVRLVHFTCFDASSFFIDSCFPIVRPRGTLLGAKVGWTLSFMTRSPECVPQCCWQKVVLHVIIELFLLWLSYAIVTLDTQLSFWGWAS